MTIPENGDSRTSPISARGHAGLMQVSPPGGAPLPAVVAVGRNVRTVLEAITLRHTFSTFTNAIAAIPAHRRNIAGVPCDSKASIHSSLASQRAAFASFVGSSLASPPTPIPGAIPWSGFLI
jgi:hypothetical protein